MPKTYAKIVMPKKKLGENRYEKMKYKNRYARNQMPKL